MTYVTTASPILKNLEQWSLRMSWLELQLMFKQYPNIGSSELNQWLDMVARAAIDVFQIPSESQEKINRYLFALCIKYL